MADSEERKETRQSRTHGSGSCHTSGIGAEAASAEKEEKLSRTVRLCSNQSDLQLLRLASNRLTRQQVETIFTKGKVSVSFEPMKVSDLVEVLNHCVCVDYILDHAQEPLTPKFIKDLHYQLVFGTVDDRRKRVAPGQYRSPKSSRKVPFMLPADQVSSKLKALIAEYEALTEVERRDILRFHVRFERIFPFEDCNGRIGRLILFKECLRHDVMPFIIDDKRRNRYLEGLREWDNDPGILTEVVMEAQSRFDAQIQLQNLSEHRHNFLSAGVMED